MSSNNTNDNLLDDELPEGSNQEADAQSTMDDEWDSIMTDEASAGASRVGRPADDQGVEDLLRDIEHHPTDDTQDIEPESVVEDDFLDDVIFDAHDESADTDDVHQEDHDPYEDQTKELDESEEMDLSEQSSAAEEDSAYESGADNTSPVEKAKEWAGKNKANLIIGSVGVVFLGLILTFLMNVLNLFNQVAPQETLAQQDDYLKNIDMPQKGTPSTDDMTFNIPGAGDSVAKNEAPATQPPPIPTAQVNPPAVMDISGEMAKREAQMRLEFQKELQKIKDKQAEITNESSRPAVVEKQPITDSVMVDKNTAAILKIAEKMQGYESINREIAAAIQGIRADQAALRSIAEANAKTIESNQAAIQTLATSIIDVKGSLANRGSSQYRVKTTPAKREPPTYEVISASPNVVFLKSRKNHGEPIPIVPGDMLIGYGRVTAIDGYGQIMTTSGRVKTR